MATNNKPDLIPVMEKFGLIPKRTSQKSMKFVCPFHNDQGRPNLHVWLESDTWKCFRCGKSGDVIDFVGFMEYGDLWNNRDREMFPKVLEILELKDYKPIQRNDAKSEYKPYVMSKEVKDVLVYAANIYHSVLINNKNGERALNYLESRGISRVTINRLKLGYVIPGVLNSALSTYPKKLQEAAKTAGLYYKGSNEKYREFLQWRITFPDFTPEGIVNNIVGRSLTSNKDFRFLALPGLPQSLYLLSMVPKNSPIILMESMTDALSARHLGFPAVAVNGTDMSPDNIKKLERYPIIAIFGQNDVPGQNAVEKWKKDYVPHGRVLYIPYSDGEKDLNDLLINRGEDETRKIILHALELEKIVIELFSPSTVPNYSYISR